MNSKSSLSTVRSLERGLKILECFKTHLSLSLTEISDITGLSTSTCDRLLKTLLESNFLDRNYQKKYTIGDNLYEFLNVLSHRSDLVELAYPFLKELTENFNETSSLYIAQNENRVCISSVESTFALRRNVPVGEVLPLTRGAVGDVFLAFMDIEQRNKLTSNLTREKIAELVEIKRNGYSENDGLQEEGVLAIAAPVFNSENYNIGVLSVSGPSNRMQRKRDVIIESIIKHSKRLSKQLGATENI